MKNKTLRKAVASMAIAFVLLCTCFLSVSAADFESVGIWYTATDTSDNWFTLNAYDVYKIHIYPNEYSLGATYYIVINGDTYTETLDGEFFNQELVLEGTAYEIVNSLVGDIPTDDTYTFALKMSPASLGWDYYCELYEAIPEQENGFLNTITTFFTNIGNSVKLFAYDFIYTNGEVNPHFSNLMVYFLGGVCLSVFVYVLSRLFRKGRNI